jgi:N-formylglutamate amidohydrolase
VTGIEPVTPSMSTKCSPAELHPRTISCEPGPVVGLPGVASYGLSTKGYICTNRQRLSSVFWVFVDRLRTRSETRAKTKHLYCCPTRAKIRCLSMSNYNPKLGPNQNPDLNLASDSSSVRLPVEVISSSVVDSSSSQSPVLETVKTTVSPQKMPGPVVFSCPHSGRVYPADFIANCAVTIEDLRGLEDFATDYLIAALPDLGIVTIHNIVARAYIDVNREKDELDANMFSCANKISVGQPTRLLSAGYGLLPRMTANRQLIHRHHLAPDEANRRINFAYTPYHNALLAALNQAHNIHGACLLIDVHSMPPNDNNNRPLADIVLGDLHHTSLDCIFRHALEKIITDSGLSLSWNTPYAGGHITKHYGRANSSRQAVQIEINRRLYMRSGLQLDPVGSMRVQHVLNKIGIALNQVLRSN